MYKPLDLGSEGEERIQGDWVPWDSDNQVGERGATGLEGRDGDSVLGIEHLEYLWFLQA